MKNTKPALKKGGGAISGIGETFQPNPFSGTSDFFIPIGMSSCRGFEPKLNLSYSSGTGNGFFGVGFQVSLPTISRKTAHQFPKYDATDTFLISNADDLVPLLNAAGEPTIETIALEDITYTVQSYRPRTEGLFASIQQWRIPGTDTIFWKVITSDNTTSFFGKTAAARVADPANNQKIFKWLLEDHLDAKGNHVHYEYKAENNDNIPNDLTEGNRSVGANKYIHKIQYGSFQDINNQQAWHFEAVFDYGERQLDDPNAITYSETHLWSKRLDSFSSFQAGFEIRTHRLCRGILMFHRFEELSVNPVLVNSMLLNYEESPTLSFLTTIQSTGYQQDKARVLISKSMPPLAFDYSTSDPSYLFYLDDQYTTQLNGGTSEDLIVLQREFKFKGLVLTDAAQISTTTTPKHWQIIDGAERYLIRAENNRLKVFDPKQKASFLSLSIENGNRLPGPINGDGYQMIDLYGEGLSGIFYHNERTVFYQQPKGAGQFAAPQEIRSFPNDLEQFNLMDLEGIGAMDFVLNNPQENGYYQNHQDGDWTTFTAFENYPNDAPNSFAKMLDVTGNGLADLLVFENENVKVFPSKGRKGFEASYSKLKDPTLPSSQNLSATEVIRFGDIFGDGKHHLIKITNGTVACWPNLGYGCFGKKINLGNAPNFGEQLDAKRLFLADIDGSGTTDLIYAYEDRVAVFYNQAGNTFSEPQTVYLPGNYQDLSQISFADILGNGTSCLVLTTIDSDLSLKQTYFAFTGNTKPNLLVEVVDNLGSSTRYQYSPSTKFYLQDAAAGRPWKTKLHFPVQLIEKSETIDLISGSKFVQRYAYHDGYFDPVEKEFRGFGFVETWDTESFENYEQEDLHGAVDFEVNEAHYVAPVYTKSWYHTGAFYKAKILSNQYAADYYQNDLALVLSDTILDESFNESDGETMREAYRALHGKLLRKEIYGQDADLAPDLVDHPYLVSESNFSVRLVQAKATQKWAVCIVLPNETITSHYERNPLDPRIEHDFTTEVDPYGQVLKSCKVFYPRRTPEYAEQAKIRIVTAENQVINETEAFRLLGIPYEQKSFEIRGADLAPNTYFTSDQIKTLIQSALENPLSDTQDFSGTAPQSKLLSWSQHYFWNADQLSALPLGQITAQALSHHQEAAVFTTALVEDVYGDKVDTDLLETAGYLMDKNNLWWQPNSTQFYKDASGFYLPYKTEDPFGAISEIVYDDHYILPQSSTDALGSTTTLENDYCFLTPTKVTDLNANVSEVLFDPLGQVIATTVYGYQNDQLAGDLDLSNYVLPTEQNKDAIIANPQNYLQEASSYFYYDLWAWKNNRQPVFNLALYREKHVQDLTVGETTKIQSHLTYSDGLGRVLQSKTNAGVGNAFLRDNNGQLLYDKNGNLEEGISQNRWLVSNRTEYNNKGGAVKQYEAFYSSTSNYESEKELCEYGVTSVLTYDPLMRVIRTDTAKGFFTKVIFSPWEIAHYDKNDTILDSPYYQQNNGSNALTADEQDALDKAVLHYNTPSQSIFDNMSRPFLSIQCLGNLDNDPVRLKTHQELDIKGQVLTSTDPRFYQTAIANAHHNFTHRYDLLGNPLWSSSVDAGENWIFKNILGQEIHLWDSRNFHTQLTYDVLRRPLTIHVSGDDENGLVMNQFVERIEYGEGQPGDQNKNLRGQALRHYDEAGIQYYDGYSISGALLLSRRQLRKDYKTMSNWNDPTTVEMETEIFQTASQFDALGRVESTTHPDGSISTPEYYPEGWLKTENVLLTDGTNKKFVEEITYDAKGQRRSIRYGNDTRTIYTYETTTYRLLSLKTSRLSDQEVMQDLQYAYDPHGNITRLRDLSQSTVYTNNQVVEALSDYTYDALYQLIVATGREHPALNGQEYQNPDYALKQSQYLTVNNGSTLQNYTRNFTYDLAGNLSQKQHIASDSTRSWTKDLTISDTSNQLVDQSYDAHGNINHLDHLRAINWNYHDQMASIDLIQRDKQPNDSEYYVYDGNGQRIRKISERLMNGNQVEIEEKIYLGSVEIKRIKTQVGGTTTQTFERQTLQVMDDQNRIATVHRWIQDDFNREVNTLDTWQSRYQYDNHLGSIALELDAGGALISYEEYFPYGGTSFVVGKSQKEVKLKEYRYSGKEKDDRSSLYYYGARYYATWLGRWLNPDPAGTVDGLNLYAFVGGNPINYIDATGHLKGKKTTSKSPIKKKQAKSNNAQKKRTAILTKKINEQITVHKNATQGDLEPFLRGTTKIKKGPDNFKKNRVGFTANLADKYLYASGTVYSQLKINGAALYSGWNSAADPGLHFHNIGYDSTHEHLKENPHSEDWTISSYFQEKKEDKFTTHRGF
ncbi:MAG: SpvB/TcaC N-terminal domain-containing protein, partial [Saprospiraceae bacterium]